MTASPVRITGIFRDIAQAYTNRDIMAMRIAMLKVPSINDHLEWDARPVVEKPLSKPFHDEFLFAKKLSDFDSPEQFTKFIKANTEVALFFADVFARGSTSTGRSARAPSMPRSYIRSSRLRTTRRWNRLESLQRRH